MIIKLALIVVCLLVNSSYVLAAQKIIAEEDGEFEAFIAKDELSRIKIIDDRIRAIRANDNELVVQEDASLGEVYLLPLVDKAINVFITTEKNHTIKLLLKVKKSHAEQIFIKFVVEEQDVIRDKDAGLDSVVYELTNLVAAMQGNRDLEGYQRHSGTYEIESEGIKYEIKEQYIGDEYIGQIISKDKRIDSRNFQNKAIALTSIGDVSDWDPNEEIIVIIKREQ